MGKHLVIEAVIGIYKSAITGSVLYWWLFNFEAVHKCEHQDCDWHLKALIISGILSVHLILQPSITGEYRGGWGR